MKIQAWAAVGVTVLAACGTPKNEQGASSSGDGGGGGSTAASTGPTTTGAGASTGTTTTSTGTTTGTGTTTTGGVTVYVAPDTGLLGQIVTAIEGATTSVHMTMYILDDAKIVAALVDRRKAGLDVRVVLNQTFPTGTVQTNPATYTTLTTAGVGVVWRNGPPGSTPPTYTHEKTFILDGKQAWIMTMNLDTSAPIDNREYVVVDDNAADAQEADQIFLADFGGTASTLASPLVVSPDPPCNSRAALVALINGATKTLDVEVEEFSDAYTNGVVAAVAAAAHRGVATRVILANTSPVASQTTAIATVKAAGAKVVIAGGTSGKSTAAHPYIHAKAITVDCTGTTCARGFLGSENFSEGSLGYNRELGIVIDDPTQLAKVEAAIDTDFSSGTAQ
jgi:phosphatidylserine/phosphatidylglycerophosphate/cardiolipin synthase-like enzyme